MKRSDLGLALLVLGLNIDRLEREGFTDLMDMKHAYLRINHYMIKTSNVPPQEFQSTIDALLSLDEGHDLKPNWLPCNKSPLQRHRLPCIRLGDVCHCAQLLQCNVEEDDVSSSLVLSET